MRSSSALVAASALVLGVATTASADVRPFSATISIILSNLAPPNAASVTRTGSATVNGSLGGSHVSSFQLGAGVFSQAFAASPLNLSMSLISLQLTLTNQTGSFAGLSGGSGGGSMPLGSRATICLYISCAPFAPNIVIPLTANAGATGVGVGGTVLGPGLISVTVRGLGPWTQGTASVLRTFPGGTISTLMGFAHGPASAASTTNAPSGVIQLVTPIDIRTSLMTAFPQIVAFGVLTVHLVPEPATLLLLGSGIVTLGALGRRRLGAGSG